MITDCQTVGGLPAGEYESGGMTLVVDDKIARLKDGTIAGSVISQNIALKNFYLNSNITLPQAVKMASLNQAELLGIGNITGSISVGKKADFAILNKEFDAEMTIVEGKVKFEKGKYS